MTASPPPVAAPPQRRRSWRQRLVLLGAASLASLLLAEVGARVGLWLLDALPRSLARGGESVELIDMIQPSPHADIVYELRPGLSCRYRGVDVTTNTAGFRGPEHALAKPAAAFRVLGLGDSVLFGWGVPWADAGIAQLERVLQHRLPGRTVETIGTGVPGYNTAMQLEVLRQKGLAYAPDVVLVDLVGNDFDLPNFLLQPTDYWRLDRSYLPVLLERARRQHRNDPRGPFVWAPADANGNFESDPERVPPAYRHLVGPENYRRALQGMLELGRRHGFRVLVTCHHDMLREAKAICTELQVPFVEQGKRIRAWMKERGLVEFQGSPLSVGPGDPHPSALVHGWWAEAVADRLAELGWLP
jgi:hypothetical protein